MHRGTVLTEQYFGEMSAETPHLLMSTSTSLVGAVAGALCNSGVLHADAQSTDYLPELAEAAYAEATVRQLLDMRSGIDFSENYLVPSAGVRMMEQAIGWSAPQGSRTHWHVPVLAHVGPKDGPRRCI